MPGPGITASQTTWSKGAGTTERRVLRGPVVMNAAGHHMSLPRRSCTCLRDPYLCPLGHGLRFLPVEPGL